MNRPRFYEIDLFRFIAALSVVMFHYTFRGGFDNAYMNIQFPYIGEVTKYGYLGVELFFIISGFVILMSASNSNTSKFLVGRVCRLYPAFIVSVSLTALFIYFLADNRFSINLYQYLTNLTMMSGFFGIRHVDGVYWSLLVEIKFYFLVTMILMLNLIRFAKPILLGWLVLAWLSKWITLPWYINFVFFPEWAGYFIAGCTFFLIRQEGSSLFKWIVIFCSYLLCLKQAVINIKDFQDSYNIILSSPIVMLLISVFFLVFVFVSLDKTQIINKKQMISLGVLTYPLYLVHQNIGYIIFNVFEESVNQYILLFCILTLAIAISYAINKFIEKPLAPKIKSALTFSFLNLKNAEQKL